MENIFKLGSLIIFALFFSINSCNKQFPDEISTIDSTLIIATFNCEFLWDGREPEEGQVDFPHKNNPDSADAHIQEIAEIIRIINADIINLVEVENIETLNRLNDVYLKDMDYNTYLVKGKDSYTGQDVALLTKYKIDSINRTDERALTTGNDDYGVSKNYYAKLKINNQKIALIGIHFLSDPSSYSKIIKREAQANVISKLCKKMQTEGYKPVVMGDFNDYDADVPDLNNNFPITKVLSIVKDIDSSTRDDNLINVSKYLPQYQRYTAHWDKNDNNFLDGNEELSMIDHILISPQLNFNIDSVKTINYYNPVEISDHFPVIAYLSLRN